MGFKKGEHKNDVRETKPCHEVLKHTKTVKEYRKTLISTA